MVLIVISAKEVIDDVWIFVGLLVILGIIIICNSGDSRGRKSSGGWDFPDIGGDD